MSYPDEQDYEDLYGPNEQSFYEYVMDRIFRKGADVAESHFEKPMPENPYKKPEYRREWERGYGIKTRLMKERQKGEEWYSRNFNSEQNGIAF